jgi:endonuclease/exonuclease/phosphatase family metal-dependent hydrolase
MHVWANAEEARERSASLRRHGHCTGQIRMKHSLAAIALPLSLVASVSACMVGDDPDDVGLLEGGNNTAAIRIVQHNIEKNDAALDNAIQHAKAANATAITLEEVCPDQLAKLRQKHADEWTIADTESAHPPVTGCNVLAGGVHEKTHVVAIWMGGKNGDTHSYGQLGPTADTVGQMACVKFPKAGNTLHVCAVKLNSTGGDDIRANETAKIASIAGDWIAKGDFAVIGGDFNAEPDMKSLDNMYVHAVGDGGHGQFTEYNRTGNGRKGQITAHANGDHTEDGIPYTKKIDYVFFSTNRAPIDGPAVSLDKDQSDHDMLTSTAQMRK